MKSLKNTATAILFACIAATAGVAACGAPPSPQSPDQQPPAAGESPPGSSSAGGAPGGASSAPPAGSAAVPGGPSTVPPGTPAAPMKPIAASTMSADLQTLGLDLKSLPALEKMDPAKLRKVMRTFTKALGAKCSDCHNESDYAAMTPMKKITLHMWNDYVRGMGQENGDALYCDSCHQGRMKFLDRHDKKQLAQWMDLNYVDKIKRRDGKEQTCATCHGEPFDGDFLDRWAK